MVSNIDVKIILTRNPIFSFLPTFLISFLNCEALYQVRLSCNPNFISMVSLVLHLIQRSWPFLLQPFPHSSLLL